MNELHMELAVKVISIRNYIFFCGNIKHRHFWKQGYGGWHVVSICLGASCISRCIRISLLVAFHVKTQWVLWEASSQTDRSSRTTLLAVVTDRELCCM